MSDEKHVQELAVIANKSMAWVDPGIELREVMMQKVVLQTSIEELLKDFQEVTGLVPKGVEYRQYKSKRTGGVVFEVKVLLEI